MSILSQKQIVFLNNDPVDSEPDEVEIDEGQNDTDPDDDEVSIPVMLDVLGKVPVDSYDIPSSSWGHFYDSNSGKLECGMIFKTKAHLIASVQDFSVRFARREYRVVESKPKLWKVACKYDDATGCNWMLRGIFKAKMDYLKLPNPAYNIKYVQQNVKDNFGFDISYHKAWHALKAAREQTMYRGIPLLSQLISIDGTRLYTKYKHKLLVAVTMDANQQILPIAFALVDEESLASWRWFLEMLAKHLMLDDDDRICLISDRHSGLINAINLCQLLHFHVGSNIFAYGMFVRTLTRSTRTFS
ncbi:UNVERIFIED_CONTAM: hypothetical protein Slati_4003700 [Sesamum latifolium]|uniref:MULE transposase domain-containing protein n=1 Tax=Sesamum latifolium TaxID=2727402 RepID=A0AAW2TQV6_9LAMI